jgi:uncharacterized protein YjhX (UPF0386 family)
MDVCKEQQTKLQCHTATGWIEITGYVSTAIAVVQHISNDGYIYQKVQVSVCVRHSDMFHVIIYSTELQW